MKNSELTMTNVLESFIPAKPVEKYFPLQGRRVIENQRYKTPFVPIINNLEGGQKY
jgi:hypothetical protein